MNQRRRLILALGAAPLLARAQASEFDKYVSIKTVKKGDGGAKPKPGDMVSCHYVLTVDGKQVDSSRDRGQPFRFRVGQGQVIRGWDEGLQRFSKGERAIMTIQHQYGYGERGIPPAIPPRATLVFDTELLDFGK